VGGARPRRARLARPHHDAHRHPTAARPTPITTRPTPQTAAASRPGICRPGRSRPRHRVASTRVSGRPPVSVRNLSSTRQRITAGADDDVLVEVGMGVGPVGFDVEQQELLVVVVCDTVEGFEHKRMPQNPCREEPDCATASRRARMCAMYGNQSSGTARITRRRRPERAIGRARSG
jgi:hypothetical protein